jgi:hypothetical protein
VNGFWATHSLAPYSSHMVCTIALNQKVVANQKFVTGTFWLVQGTSLMPFFAVGTMYSPDGNTLEGMETAEYSATVGEFRLSR